MLLGSETPRLFTNAARPLTPETSLGFECIAFAEQVLGLELMPWQRWLLIHGLELAEDQSFRFRTLLVLVARQQGKTTVSQVLSLWRLYVDRAGLVIGTAQNLSMAEESWDGAVSMAEGVPDLAGEIAQTSRVNGDKFLRLSSGERYKVTAATRRGGRGLSSDLVILDELREHRDWDAWGAVTKTTMARPSPQVVGFSNAGDAGSVVLAELRDKALIAVDDPASTLGIFEWSAPDGCELDDREAWAAANPALGHRVTELAIASALATDPEPVFRTEVLCQWVAAVAPAIDASLWSSLHGSTPPQGVDTVFALDVAPDQSTATIAAAWTTPDGRWVQLAESLPGVEWVVGRCAELLASWGGRLLVEQTGTAAFLLPLLDAEGVSRRFYADACSALDAAISGRTLRHGNQPELNGAVSVARWSSSGEAGQRVLSRKDPRVSPLVAAALAVHGLATSAPRGGWMVGI